MRIDISYNFNDFLTLSSPPLYSSLIDCATVSPATNLFVQGTV